jgi:hypothetical protein
MAGTPDSVRLIEDNHPAVMLNAGCALTAHSAAEILRSDLSRGKAKSLRRSIHSERVARFARIERPNE